MGNVRSWNERIKIVLRWSGEKADFLGEDLDLSYPVQKKKTFLSSNKATPSPGLPRSRSDGLRTPSIIDLRESRPTLSRARAPRLI